MVGSLSATETSTTECLYLKLRECDSNVGRNIGMKEGKDCKIQNTRESVVRYCLLNVTQKIHSRKLRNMAAWTRSEQHTRWHMKVHKKNLLSHRQNNRKLKTAKTWESKFHTDDTMVELKEYHCRNRSKEEREKKAGHKDQTLHTHPGENDQRMWK